MVRYGLFLAAPALYAWVMADRTLDLEWTQVLTEAPLLLYAFLLLQAPLRESRYKPLVAALPLAWIYGVHDKCLLMLGKLPDFADLGLLPELFVSLNTLRRIGVVLLIAAPVVIWLAAFEYPLRRPRWTTILFALPALLLTAAVLRAPTASYELIDSMTADEEWSDRLTAEHWGRLYTLVMREARRGSFVSGISGYTPIEHSPLHLDNELLHSLDGRNVHVIVMESFVDVRLLRDVHFSRPPLAPEFTSWTDPYVGSSISPVFGGETARAEFEVLCGVPSLHLYGLEFLGFSGAKTYCLPTILGDAGYQTVLTFPHGPVFFNTRHAYPGLGFQQVIFADRFSSPGQESIKLGDQDYLYDGDFFPQNLEKVRRLVKAGRPFLNYVMTMYGHWPFDIDTEHHPLRVKVTPPIDDLEKIANQMLQRTEALNDYLHGLLAVDPKSIIVMVADHLPPLPNGTDDYDRLHYQSRAGLKGPARASTDYEQFLLVIIDGKPRKVPLMRHFDLSHYILNELSHGAYCQKKRCDFGRLPVDKRSYLDEYRTILGLASRT